MGNEKRILNKRFMEHLTLSAEKIHTIGKEIDAKPLLDIVMKKKRGT